MLTIRFVNGLPIYIVVICASEFVYDLFSWLAYCAYAKDITRWIRVFCKRKEREREKYFGTYATSFGLSSWLIGPPFTTGSVRESRCPRVMLISGYPFTRVVIAIRRSPRPLHLLCDLPRLHFPRVSKRFRVTSLDFSRIHSVFPVWET